MEHNPIDPVMAVIAYVESHLNEHLDLETAANEVHYSKYHLHRMFTAAAGMIQTVFSNLFVTAGKPGLGFGLSVLAGLANIILDYIFIVICSLGIRGAALGTGCGYLIPAVIGGIFLPEPEGYSLLQSPDGNGA